MDSNTHCTLKHAQDVHVGSKPAETCPCYLCWDAKFVTLLWRTLNVTQMELFVGRCFLVFTDGFCIPQDAALVAPRQAPGRQNLDKDLRYIMLHEDSRYKMLDEHHG